MAEPTNTPMPGSTPVPGATPRSTSPVQFGSTPPTSYPISALSSLSPTTKHGAVQVAAVLQAAAAAAVTESTSKPKLRVLHIGDPIQYHPALYAEFASRFDIVRPTTAAERSRTEFAEALRSRRFGDFHAIFRPFWGSGGEMGRWDEELIALLPPTVRVFASAGSGYDWADVRALGRRGIIYCNSAPAAAASVADFALALLISTFRVVPWCLSAATSASTDDFTACHGDATSESRLLRGHVVGLVGLGNIGQEVARRCRFGFDMDVHYHDVVRKDATPMPVPPAWGAWSTDDGTISVERWLGATYHASLESLLRASDVVILAAPGSPDGRKLVDAASLAWFKPGARFVNVARGSLVDEEALADALEEGRLAAVALDVHENEPKVNERLRLMATARNGKGAGRVTLSCHNAGGTVDTHRGFEELSMRNIIAVLGGGKPLTPVNLEFLEKD